MDLERLTMLFRRWSDIEAIANLSPLYGLLGHAVADNPDLLALSSEALPGQPPPNILFGTVHALLAQKPGEPLARYYATLGGTMPPSSEASRLFTEFCFANRDALLPVIRTRLVQTNEVRRSALLLPAFAEVSQLSRQSLALLEIGPSAGLNLLFDHYRYEYGDFAVGDETSPVTLVCEPRGPVPRVEIPRVASRLGIDINPLDVSNADDVAWLRALIWPEHTDRLALLDAAIKVAQANPPRLVRGDLFDYLEESHLPAVPADAAVCIFATFVLHQLTPEMRERLAQRLLDLSHRRDIYLVQVGSPDFIEPGAQLAGEEQIWILRVHEGAGEYRISSIANPHGRWITMQPGSPWKSWRPPV
ncbi:MAG: DUF2332 domain-containing protein [Dehalococcoidia bacterium]